MRLFVFLLVISTILKSQSNDTLLESILAIRSDTERVNQLYKRGFNLRNNNPSLSFRYAKLCQQHANSGHSKKHLAKSYNLLGVLFYKKGDFKKAIRYHKEALRLRLECNDVLGIAFSQTNLGNIYVDLKQFKMAESSHLKALEAYKNLNDEPRIANCLINLGALKQHMDLQDAAYEYYKLALQFGETLNDYDIRSICLNNIAIVFASKRDFEKSIAYNEDALKLRNLMDNNVEVTDSYLNLASNYIQLNQLDKAKYHLDTAFSLSKHFEYYEAEQEAYKIYSEYYSAVKKYEHAYQYLKSYYLSRDSLLTEQHSEQQLFNFDEGNDLLLNETGGLHNVWLLILVFIISLSIPYFLMRYKR